MTNLHASHYADAMDYIESPVLVNEEIAEETFLVRVVAPQIAATFRPGQFVMIRMAATDAPLIGRAFAIYDAHADADGAPHSIDLIYLRKGTFTQALASSPAGASVSLWGPLGNGFSDAPCDRLIMAVGGIGQTPMLVTGREALIKGWAGKVEMIYGARRASLLAGIDQFSDAGFEMSICTDDGSLGQQALVPDVLAERIEEALLADPNTRIRILTCGPEIMMQKVSEVAQKHGLPAEVSMETPMACGIGICFSCVAKVMQDDGEWDYKRTCVEGPIFDSAKICWD